MRKSIVPFAVSLVAVLALFTQQASGQQRIATIQNFVGETEVEHSAQIIKPIKIGKVIRNGDVFDSDTVRTRKGEADLLVIDGSVIRMDQNTTIYASFEALKAKPSAPAPTTAELDRKFRVVVGRIWCDIKPSRTYATKFELPDGVAAVRGTTLEFNVSSVGDWSVFVDNVTSGAVTLVQLSTGAEMSLTSGSRISSGRGAGNSIRFSNTGTQNIDVVLPDGSRISNFGPGDVIEIPRMPDGTYAIKCVTGSVTFTDGTTGTTTTLNEGQTAESSPPVPPGGGPPGEGGVPPGAGGGGAGGGAMSPSGGGSSTSSTGCQ